MYIYILLIIINIEKDIFMTNYWQKWTFQSNL